MLVLGLAVGVVQTATQIREQSIPFVVKLAGVAVLSSVGGKLMMGGVEDYAQRLILSLPGLVHAGLTHG
jgi:flagellar biosynthetic protein FliQ